MQEGGMLFLVMIISKEGSDDVDNFVFFFLFLCCLFLF